MDDKAIVDLYFQRNEQAITETKNKYEKYCFVIADNILHCYEDDMECLNDTYLDTWNAIPPDRPSILKTYIGKISRRRAIDMVRKKTAEKRGSGEYVLSLDELGDCFSSDVSTDELVNAKELAERINYFLSTLDKSERQVFVCRYYYFDPLNDIAKRFGFTVSKVKMSLKRSRDKLREFLLKEGYSL